jgi:DNA-binding response OmpR family regulator
MILIDTLKLDANCLNMVRRLRAETIAPILMLMYAVSEDTIVDAYIAGADECILKPIGPTLIIAKVRAWMRRNWTMSSQAMENIRLNDFVLLVSGRTLLQGSKPPIKLTNLELRLMHLLLSLSPRALGHDEIIQRVWGYVSDADTAALKNVVYRLRQKIENDPAQPRYLLTVSGMGYKFVAE